MDGQALRILCVTPWFPNTASDGRYNFILHSIDALVDAGHRVRVLITRPWIPAPLRLLDASWQHAAARPASDTLTRAQRVETIRFPSIPRYVFSEYADALYRRATGGRIASAIHEERPDVVHAHTERAGYAAVAAARELGVASAVTLHGINTAPQLLDTAGKRARLRDTLRHAGRVVLVGEPLRAHFGPLAGGDANFRVVPNGFFLHGSGVADPFRHPTLRFVSVSKLAEGKGVDLTLRALARLDASGARDWMYVIAGDGPERGHLESLSRTLGLAGRVTFAGDLPHDRALALLPGSDIFVLPSYREAFGVAYLEAMASGLLTMGVAGQGPSAFIAHDETGLLVEPRSVDALYLAMRYASDNRDRMAAIARAGRAHACEEFTWARHAARLTDVFDEAIRDRR
jgi:glycosyltransferase involved in cell wall biosynthesis